MESIVMRPSLTISRGGEDFVGDTSLFSASGPEITDPDVIVWFSRPVDRVALVNGFRDAEGEASSFQNDLVGPCVWLRVRRGVWFLELGERAELLCCDMT